MRRRRVLCALVLALTFSQAEQSTGWAQTPPPDDCALIGVEEAGMILGTGVSAPDDVTRRQGRCLFASRQMSVDGIVLYAFVRAAQIPQLQLYYRALLRTCAGIAPGAPRENLCKIYGRLASAGDIDAYYAARSAVSSSRPAPEVAPAAVASNDGVFVRRDDFVLEAIVMRKQEVVIAPSIALAQLLLKRLEPKLH